MRAAEVFQGSDAAVTRAYHCDLKRAGDLGNIAVALLKAQKASNRAKRYRGGPSRGQSYSKMAYQRKQESLKELCQLLTFRGSDVQWGWKLDPNAVATRQPAKWVIYVDLPGHGQVSFHNVERLTGPDYPGEWDGRHVSAQRICSFCDSIIDSLMPTPMLTGLEIPF